MQRVATELYQALDGHRALEVEPLILRSTWRWTHILTAPFLTKALYQIRKKAREGSIDAVVFSSMVTGSLAVGLRAELAKHNIPMAVIAHGQDVTLPFKPYQWLVPKTFDALDAVLPVSSATGQACLKRGLSPSKLSVVPNGVDLSRFGQPTDKHAARLALLDELDAETLPPTSPEDGLLLCSVGRHVERKGFEWFIDNVMPLLPSNVHYWLAGTGPETARLEQAIENNQLNGRVRLLGRISEERLRKLYRGSDLFVMPNIPVAGDMEGFGVVMLEAGLCGLPTVAAGLEGITDVITDGENGHLVESGNAWEFSERILHYHKRTDRLEEASTKAAEHTSNRFSWAAIADRYVQVINSLVHPSLAPTGDGAMGDGASEPTVLDEESSWLSDE